MSIIFTTAFKDINRANWSSYNRGNTEYIKNFLKMCLMFRHPLVVYVEDEIYKTIKSIPLKLSENIIFKDSKSVNTFYDRYVDREKEVMRDDKYRNKIPTDRRDNPEHLPLGYNAVMHNKVNFMSETVRQYPDYEHYGWIDFGYLKHFLTEKDLPLTLDYSKLKSEQITFGVMESPPLDRKFTPDEMLTIHAIFFHGASFIVPKGLMFSYEKLYEEKVLELYDTYVSDDDQNIVYQIWVDHPEIFQYFKMSSWMKLYYDHLNL